MRQESAGQKLSLVVGDADLACYQRTAQAAGISVSEWVRQALRVAQREASDGSIDAKLAAMRKAVSGDIPDREVDLGTMLAEIGAARLAEIEPGVPHEGSA